MIKKNILIYIPTGLNHPELQVLIDKAQQEIYKKNKVIILTCPGGGDYACSKKIYPKLNGLCKLCNSMKFKAINSLIGNYELIYTPKNLNKDKISLNFQSKIKNINFKKIIDLKYKNIDIGLGAYASYVGLTRDMELESDNASNVCNKLIVTSAVLTDYFEKIIKTYKINYVVLFNSRMNLYRPLFRFSQNKNIQISNLEFKRLNHQAFDFKNFFSMDILNLSNKINNFWKKNKKNINKKRLIKHFYDKLDGLPSLDVKSFVAFQDPEKLPSNWKSEKINLVYFTASDDELISYGKQYDLKIYKDQNDAIEQLGKLLKKSKFKNYHLWIKMHPNMKSLDWSFVIRQKNFSKKFKNVSVIFPESKISTYKMMLNADLVIGTSSSHTIVEGNFFNKKTLTIGPSIWEHVGVSVGPKNHKQMVFYLSNLKKLKSDKINSLKFAAFWLFGGKKLKSLKPDKNYNYYYRGKLFKLNLLEKSYYLFNKLLEFTITYYFQKKFFLKRIFYKS